MDGLERLEKEAVEMNNHNVILIFNYIKEKESLRDKFNNEEKTIKGMYEFICNKARTVSQNNVAMVQDNIVYLWAMAYFNKTNEELGINKKVSTPKKETKKTEVKKEESKALFEIEYTEASIDRLSILAFLKVELPISFTSIFASFEGITKFLLEPE